MQNISLNNESIELKCDIKYIIIDALYINDIKQQLFNLKRDNILNEIRSVVFPYTDTPFAEYFSTKNIFILNQIKKVEYNEITPGDNSVLSTDTGVLIFINEKILTEFTKKYDYGELVNSSTDLLNINYWNSVVNNFNIFDLAIIISPGINTGVEFDGSGLYKILIE